jgi:hypothetical protein
MDFKVPRRGNHRPYLILKKNHQMQRAFITLNNIIASIKANHINFDDEIDAMPLQIIPETFHGLVQEPTTLNQSAQNNVSSNPWPLSLSGFNTFVDNLSVTQQSTPYLPPYNEEALVEALEPTVEEAAAVNMSSSSQLEFTANDIPEDTHSQRTLWLSDFSEATVIEDYEPIEQEAPDSNILYLPPEHFTTEQEKTMWSPAFTEDTLSQEYYPISENTSQNNPFLTESSEHTETENVLYLSPLAKLLPIEEEQEQAQYKQANDEHYASTSMPIEENMQRQTPFNQVPLK